MAAYQRKNNPLLNQETILVAPGASDVLTAKLIQHIGFNAVYMTGFGATASRLAAPDIGLLTQTEMTSHARNMVSAVDIPVIADADTGYGGLANLSRTVEEYMKTGVAAIHLEDQTMPKRCGQLAGVTVIPKEEAVNRLKCAVNIRGDSEMLIIGRTDALSATSIDDAIDRAKAYEQAGVDLIFIDGVKKIKHAEIIAENIDTPKIIAIIETNETINLSNADLQEMGFSIVLYPLSALMSAVFAITKTLEELKKTGSTINSKKNMTEYDNFTRLINYEYYTGIEQRFGGKKKD